MKISQSLKEHIRAKYIPNKVTQSMLAKEYDLSFNMIHHIIQQATCVAKIQRFDLDIEPKLAKIAEEYKVSFNTLVNNILRNFINQP